MGYRFEKLMAWQKAMDFCTVVYEVSRGFPKTEIYGLTSQLRRATTSIPLNIAEGSARSSDREFIRFLQIALGSQYEVVTIIKLSNRLGYIDNERLGLLESEIAEIGRLIQGLINSLKSNDQRLTTND